MTTFFKRILSPREHRGDRRNSEDFQERSLSTSLSQGHLPTVPPHPVSSSSTASGGPHRQHQSNEGDSIVVDNVIYSEPTPLDRVPRGPGQSGAGDGEGQPDNPPLPPRPVSAGHPYQLGERREEEFYQAPVDTIRTAVAPSVLASRERDRRIMRMHDLTMSQKARQGMQVQNVRVQQHSPSSSPSVGGHRRTRSIGHVIDNSEYSTPWNVVEEQMRAAGPPTRKKASAGRMIPSVPSVPGDERDNIIPVSPPPILDRTHSPSPTPPLPSEPPPHSPGEGGGGGGGGDAEYDDPWDVRFRRINQNLHEHHGHSHHERPSPPQTGGGGARRSSPVGDQRPPKPPHTRTASNTERAHRFSPPEGLTRVYSDKLPHRGGGGGGGEIGEHGSEWGRGLSAPFRHRTATELHTSSGPGLVPPRAGSVSIPIQQRPLPQAPVDNKETVQLPVNREDSPPSGCWFDSNLALEEQPWYHGAITRADAEAILADKEDFSFLVRNSESCRTDYSLSIRDHASGFIHLRIVYERSGYVLGQFSSHFQAVPECIFFYTQQRLNIRGTDHKKLKYPVPKDRSRVS